MPKLTEVRVPDIGDFDNVDVVEVFVEAGAHVDAEQSLITIESEKASLEIPAPAAGTVKEVKVSVGDKVSEGSVIVILEMEDGTEEAGSDAAKKEEPARENKEKKASADAKKKQQPKVAEDEQEPEADEKAETEDDTEADEDQEEEREEEKAAKPRPAPETPTPPAARSPAHASPSVRRFARELGVDLDHVDGSGPKGRILKGDVQTFVKSRVSEDGRGTFSLPPLPQIDFGKFGEVESEPLTKINKLTARNVHRSWLHIPHVTQFDEADITDLEEFRKTNQKESEAKGFKLTFLAFLLKACAGTLRSFPRFNASLDESGEQLVLKHYFNIGVAVDTPRGLLVPVIHEVDVKGIFELAEELAEISGRARAGKLGPKDIQGATFSISSLGGIGGTAFTPIINAPEVAILGVARASMKPVYRGGQFVPRLILPLCLSYDHRVIDGAAAARFTTHLASLLGDIRRLAL